MKPIISEQDAKRFLDGLDTDSDVQEGGHLSHEDVMGAASANGIPSSSRIGRHVSGCSPCRTKIDKARAALAAVRTPNGRERLDQTWVSFLAAAESTAGVVTRDASQTTTNPSRSGNNFWSGLVEPWRGIGALRYAFGGLAALVFVLANALAFVLGQNSVLERVPRSDVSVPNARVVNAALQRELDAGVIQQLSSRDPRELDVAFRTARAMKMESPYIRDLAERYAATARDRIVRESATAFILDSPGAAASFERVSSTQRLRAELGAPGIRRMLEDADAYVRGGAENGATEAVKLYSEILGRLSPPARNALRAERVAAAERERAEGRLDEAAARFRDLFADLGITDEAPDGRS